VKENSAAITLVIPAARGVELDIARSADAQSKPVKIIVEEGANPSANRNRGAARATAPLIAFSNAHTILQNDWAQRVEAFFSQYSEIDIAGGPQLNYENDSYFTHLSGDALASPFCTGKMSRRYRVGDLDLDADEGSLTSANLICRRRVFDKVQFDEKLYPGEDPKFITDAKKAGFKLAYVPEVIVFNRRRKNLFALGKQIFNYGAARVQKETFFELLRHPTFFAPAMLVVYFILFPALLIWSHWSLLPLIIYFLPAIFFAIKRAAECRRAEYAILLPPLFLWIHLSYGVGFLARFFQGGFSKR
jgi:glycosyltransferase involved in cell wall biosynthesis